MQEMAIFQDKITEKSIPNCNLLISHTSRFNFVVCRVVSEVNIPGDLNSSFMNFDDYVNISSSAVFYITAAPHTHLYCGVPLCSYFPTNKTCKTSYAEKEEKTY